jgi:hypothetical protein
MYGNLRDVFLCAAGVYCVLLVVFHALIDASVCGKQCYTYIGIIHF